MSVQHCAAVHAVGCIIIEYGVCTVTIENTRGCGHTIVWRSERAESVYVCVVCWQQLPVVILLSITAAVTMFSPQLQLYIPCPLMDHLYYTILMVVTLIVWSLTPMLVVLSL